MNVAVVSSMKHPIPLHISCIRYKAGSLPICVGNHD